MNSVSKFVPHGDQNFRFKNGERIDPPYYTEKIFL